jgi:hypothetical protein
VKVNGQTVESNISKLFELDALEAALATMSAHAAERAVQTAAWSRRTWSTWGGPVLDVRGGGGRGRGGRTAVVSRGSRASWVTPRAPPTRSAPPHVGSPAITTYHHCFVGGYVVGGKGESCTRRRCNAL